MAQKFFTREMYKKLKKMDRQQVENFAVNIYEKGYNEGFEKGPNNSVPIINYNALCERIEAIKGIGKVRANKILEIVKEFMEVKHD